MTTVIDTAQRGLFGDVDDRLPPGLAFGADVIGRDDERALLALVATLPLQRARYHGHVAQRRVFAWRAAQDADQDADGDADGDGDRVGDADPRGERDTHPGVDGAGDGRRSAFSAAAPRRPGAPLAELPPPLVALRRRLARWADIDEADFVHAMVSEYTPGAPLGWHRDAPHYERIVGVSLASPARLRWRPWPHDRDAGGAAPSRADIVTLELPPRSAYSMQGPARWGWQHSLAPVAALRYSITLRTARRRD